MRTKLAIVIPAFKADFLDKALNSIVNQTCKDFKLYIGDDNSPNDLYEIVKEYEDQIDIVYRRFIENLGGQDLVAQWRRCVDMVRDEDWIWLFSDDDVMQENCVEEFYNSLNENKGEKYLYHFDINTIDETGIVLREWPHFPTLITNTTFFKLRSSNKVASFVVEYIFSREVYNKHKGFQSFDLAWGTDHSSWIKFSSGKGILTINNAKVYWRKSDKNISPNREDVEMSKRKVAASSAYYLWVREFLKKEGIKDTYYIKCFLNDNKVYARILPWDYTKNKIRLYVSKINSNYVSACLLYMFLYKFLKK